MTGFRGASSEPFTASSELSCDVSYEVSMSSHAECSESSVPLYNEGTDSRYDISANQCPLCGGDNGCAITRQLPPESCWCMSVHIPRHVRSRIPEEKRNQACICEPCAQSDISNK